MNVLMISLDKGLLNGQNKMSDSRERHLRYANALAAQYPEGHLHILVRGGEKVASTAISPTMTLYATRSPTLIFWLNSFSAARAIHKVDAIDLITTQSPFFDGFLGLVLSRYFKIPFLAQLHLSSLTSPAWRKATIFNRFRYALACWVLRQATAIRVVNRSGKKWLHDQLTIPSERIHLLPVTAVPLKAEQGISKYAHPTILYVGRLSKEKGVDILLDAFQKVVTEEAKAQLHIIGDGPEMSTLRKQATRLGIIDETRFFGALPPTHLANHYQRATLLALPSRHESFGRVIVEAFSVGLPVIATQTEGAVTLIEDGVNGLLVPTESSEALARKILTVFANPSLAARLGAQGKKTAVRYTDIPQQTEALIHCWATVAHKPVV